jgi:hypothetical protein
VKRAALVIVLLVLACAKKALPPNPDRFPPHLAEVQAVNQNRVDLVFDEGMQQKGLNVGDFLIATVRGETLKLLAASGGTDPATLTLLTDRQAEVKYLLTGTAHDQAGNPTRFTRAFFGSARPDTVGPLVSGVGPRPFSTGLRSNVTVTFAFTKPIDTLTLQQFWVLPPRVGARFRREWDPALSAVRFILADSLGPDTTVTFILPPYLKDFAGNRLDGAAFTTFTSDTAALPRVALGRLAAADKPVGDGYVVLGQAGPKLATVSRSDGSFGLRTRNEAYAVTALADTNSDGVVDLSAFRANATLPDTLVMQLEKDTTRTLVGSYFR